MTFVAVGTRAECYLFLKRRGQDGRNWIEISLNRNSQLGLFGSREKSVSHYRGFPISCVISAQGFFFLPEYMAVLVHELKVAF
jgi:hypothetical protein